MCTSSPDPHSGDFILIISHDQNHQTQLCKAALCTHFGFSLDSMLHTIPTGMEIEKQHAIKTEDNRAEQRQINTKLLSV